MSTAQKAIWTGNNSDTAFSSKTVWAALLLVSIAAGLWFWSAIRRQWQLPETVLAAGLLCYSAGLVYAVVLFYGASDGTAIAAVPWYVEVLAPPAICGLCLGLSRGGRLGGTVSMLMIWLWTYVIAATYLLKLIPFYSGFTGRVRAGAIWSHYTGAGPWREILADTAIGSHAILWLTAAVVVLAIGLAVLLSHKALRSQGPSARIQA